MEIYLKYLNFQWLIVINIAVMYNLIFVIGENIQAMMAHWKITPVNYKRKPADDPEEEGEMEQAYCSVALVQGQGDKCFWHFPIEICVL